ncbi:MAG: NAD(P)(+) transhydrogenase (Re/Si-specific) subunit beta [Desulfobacterales bacterium]
MTPFIDFSVILLLIVGIWLFREPRKARLGNLAAALALLCAFVLVLYRNGIIDAGTVVISLVVGAIAGYAVARKISMIQIPSMVAIQNGAGGAAALIVSLVELTRDVHTLDWIRGTSGVIGLAVGSLTFSGSMIAAAKLANKIRQTPQILPAHDLFVLVNIAAILGVGAASFYMPAGAAVYLYLAQIVLAASLGILFSIRVGGADMPVMISFLNAMTGVAAALCGMVIENQLLIAFGATVAASGSILTHAMCKAMNRNMFRVFLPAKQSGKLEKEINTRDLRAQAMTSVTNIAGPGHRLAEAVGNIMDAQRIIIIPGYGMALAKAQQEVAALTKKLTALGKNVRYAIHPVAGRMPGHMNVLLAEAEVDYDDLLEMDEVNPQFAETDVAMVFGACDVVNPAAMQREGTPISGMPILMAHDARKIIICNFDKNPGYSGVPNPLYDDAKTIMLLGDAKESAGTLLSSLKAMDT